LSDHQTPITQTQIESYLWGAATLLRGLIDAGDYKQFIFPLLFFKRLCDVYDEESEWLRMEPLGQLAFDLRYVGHRRSEVDGEVWPVYGVIYIDDLRPREEREEE
jgi:type I restriction enzyme M protein